MEVAESSNDVRKEPAKVDDTHVWANLRHGRFHRGPLVSLGRLLPALVLRLELLRTDVHEAIAEGMKEVWFGEIRVVAPNKLDEEHADLRH